MRVQCQLLPLVVGEARLGPFLLLCACVSVSALNGSSLRGGSDPRGGKSHLHRLRRPWREQELCPLQVPAPATGREKHPGRRLAGRAVTISQPHRPPAPPTSSSPGLQVSADEDEHVAGLPPQRLALVRRVHQGRRSRRPRLVSPAVADQAVPALPHLCAPTHYLARPGLTPRGVCLDHPSQS